MKLNHVKIKKNTAESNENGYGVGGGVYSYESNLMNLKNVVINDNTAYSAGGIYIYNDNFADGQYKFKNVTIKGNIAASTGGGIQIIFKKMRKEKINLSLREKYILQKICAIILILQAI